MDSMEEIYKKHGKMIYGFLLTRTQDPGLAEELTQETFYQAVKHIGRYKGESGISTWLCAIATTTLSCYPVFSPNPASRTVPIRHLSPNFKSGPHAPALTTRSCPAKSLNVLTSLYPPDRNNPSTASDWSYPISI